MPDLSGVPALDVAIGLFAVFFLLSTALSAINEGISNMLGWRAKTLEDAIRNMLGDPKVEQTARDLVFRGGWKRLGKVTPAPDATDTTDLLFNHWRIKALVREPDDPKERRRRMRPSYLPARAFSLALAETIADMPASPMVAPGKSAWQLTDEAILKRVKEASGDLRPQLQSLVVKAEVNARDTLEGFRGQVDHAFDDAMERASGWYKRKVQVVLLVLSIAVTIGLDVDTVRVGTAFWNDEALRSAVVAQASRDSSQDAVKTVEGLDLPIGWGSNAPDNVGAAIPGWILTIAALQLGAPFWFDLLSRLARLRGSGVPERPRSQSDASMQ
jgi:hypothetical protein